MAQGRGRWSKPSGDTSVPPLALELLPGPSSVMRKRVVSPGLEWNWYVSFARGRCGTYMRLNFP